MKYFDEIDAWLAELLLPDDEAHMDAETKDWFSYVSKEIKNKLLESYRNGKKSAGEGRELPADGKPREPKKQGFFRRRKGQ